MSFVVFKNLDTPFWYPNCEWTLLLNMWLSFNMNQKLQRQIEHLRSKLTLIHMIMFTCLLRNWVNSFCNMLPNLSHPSICIWLPTSFILYMVCSKAQNARKLEKHYIKWEHRYSGSSNGHRGLNMTNPTTFFMVCTLDGGYLSFFNLL